MIATIKIVSGNNGLSFPFLFTSDNLNHDFFILVIGDKVDLQEFIAYLSLKKYDICMKFITVWADTGRNRYFESVGAEIFLTFSLKCVAVVPS